MRKYYLDNIRWGIVILVVVYHIVYLFNSVGVVSNIGVQGIPQMDAILYFLYPWFMACLFLIGGMSARYSLEKRTPKEFAKERMKRLLVPSIAGIFILGWVNGYVTSLYINDFGQYTNQIPGVIKYLVYCFIGIGPLWFAHELFLASMTLLLVRKLDQNDVLWKSCRKMNMPALLLLFVGVWGSSQILNTPLITVYRHGIYMFLFFLGYFVFSHEEVQERLEKWRIPLAVTAMITGICYTIYYYGQNFAESSCLKSAFTNFYLWIMILAILGCGKAWWNKRSQFTDYMNKISFGVYVLHYPILVVAAQILLTYTEVPMRLVYVLLLFIVGALVPLVYEVVIRIPILRFLLVGFGEEKN